MTRALSALLLVWLPICLSTSGLAASRAPEASQSNELDQIKAAYAQVVASLSPDLEGSELDSVSRAALRQQWQLVGQYLASRAASAPPTTAEGYAAIIKALDPAVQTQVQMLDAHTAVLELIAAPGALTEGDIGHLMVVQLSPPGTPTVWHIDEAAQGQNAEALACWTTADRSCAGPITVLPADAHGDPRFFVDAAIAQLAGGTRGHQLSVWRWDGREAVLLSLQQYATGGDARDNGVHLIGDQIRIGEKGQWQTLFACGACDGRHLLQTLQIAPQGIVDQGTVSTTPELDAVDEVYTRISDDRGAEELASPAALATLRNSWAPMLGMGEHPDLFIQPPETVTHQQDRSQLCLRADYSGSDVDMIPILFTLEPRGSTLYIVNAQPGAPNCSLPAGALQDLKSEEERGLRLAAERHVLDSAPARAEVQQFVTDVTLGAPKFDQIMPEQAQQIRSQLPQIRSVLASLGAVQSVTFEGVTEGGPLIYRVRFEHGSMSWRILLTMDGRIAYAGFEPLLPQ